VRLALTELLFGLAHGGVNIRRLMSQEARNIEKF